MILHRPDNPLVAGVTFPHLAYCHNRLDRGGNLRRDPIWLDNQRQAASTRFLPLWQDQHLVRVDALGRHGIACLTGDLLRATGPDTVANSVFLGRVGRDETGHALFAVDVTALDKDTMAGWRVTAEDHWADLRAIVPLLPPDDASHAAYARGMLFWHRRHRYCGVCGHPARSEEGGHVRRCTHPACQQLHFPRTDPAVIMLVHDGSHVLLARQPRFTPGLHSVLAGFVEPGESLEDAVIREVREETGVPLQAESLRYVASQPWPYPASLMIAFSARTCTPTPPLTLQAEELEAARWVSRDWLRHQYTPGPEFLLPRADAIAHHLIQAWCAERL